MANPLSAATFQSLVTAARIPVVWHEGWRTRNRGTRGTGWGPVNGVLLHHTVTRTLAGTLDVVLTTGTPGVPPPLYAGVVDREGTLHMIGWGRCNHAGLGDPDVLQAVIAEVPAPFPNQAVTDGNSRFYGFAGINMGDGTDVWTVPQLATLTAVAALICRHHDWTRQSVIGHREWQPGKIDPFGPTAKGSAPEYLMPKLRGAVHRLLAV